jgi:soluble lytic murein transglycosylase-like protein
MIKMQNTLFGFIIAACLVLGAQPVVAVPIYDHATQWMNDETVTNHSVQQQAMRLNRLVDHIHRTYRLPQDVVVDIVTEAILHARKYDLQPELLLAIMAVESTFRENAVSSAGALGIMQVLPRAHPEKISQIGGVEALFDPRKNIATGTLILQEYLQLSRGDLRRALLRYNGSLHIPNAPYADRVLRHYRTFRSVAESDQMS